MRKLFATALVAGAFAVSACADRVPVTSSPDAPSFALNGGAPSYIIDFNGTTLPASLEADIQAAGGTVTARMDVIGVAVATSTDPAFSSKAAMIQGVRAVGIDPVVDWIGPDQDQAAVEAGDAAPEPAPAVFGSGESFRLMQWAPDAIAAPAAWDAGALGLGARVAIIDGGIHSTHVDLDGNLDVAHSASFVPGQPFNFDQRRNAAGACVLNDTFWHGTHVAGIVAAEANTTGTVGIAPSATIIGVKGLHCGSGQFSWIINAIVYAATPIADGGAGADIINMSLGAIFARQGPGAAALANAIGKATTYAYQQGTTVIAALGNNAVDLDHTANVVFFPAMAPHVIAVSATGPVGFALGSTNYDRPASYTNFGQSAVGFAGPGGDGVLPGTATCSIPRVGPGLPVTFQCWVFDLVAAPCRGATASNTTYCWASGTSMATPAVSGVAALIVGRFGRMNPSHLEARLRASADDLGKPGNDDFYGGGRVNAARAVQ
jgi:lantibiotic leader peptide-processing serine protease